MKIGAKEVSKSDRDFLIFGDVRKKAENSYLQSFVQVKALKNGSISNYKV